MNTLEQLLLQLTEAVKTFTALLTPGTDLIAEITLQGLTCKIQITRPVQHHRAKK